MKPIAVNILGYDYKIIYVDKPSDVDMYGRESLWGQIDYWTRTIRVYDNGRSENDIWQTIWHEVIHGIASGLHLNVLEKDENHDVIDLLSLALTDILFRNNWMMDG